MDAHKSSPTPIACTFGAGAYQERLAWIAELNRSALRGARRDGARLILSYDPRVTTSVREMARREQECCAFLRFELNEGRNGLMLVITAPEAARDVLDAIFDPFVTGSRSSGGSCACAMVGQ